MSDDKQRWEEFHKDRVGANYPRWPNEFMLKTIFGSYLKEPVRLPERAKVLDVGCGFGNNLLPFLDRGHECSGVEITAAIAELSQQLLADRGYTARILEGGNRRLPFPDAEFDLLLSLNVLHYESTEPAIEAALREYARVLKPGATLLLMTVGPRHEIYERATPLGGHQYRIANYDFRNGEQYFYFDNTKYLERYLTPGFERIELGRSTEELFTTTVDFLVSVARRRS